MNRERFEETLSRLGGDLTRWPAAERSQAEALIATDPQAARLHRQTCQLDEAMGALVKPVAMDAAAIGRIMAGIGHAGHRDLTLQPSRRLLAWASVAMMLFLVAGFAAGAAVPSSSSGDDDSSLAGLMFGSGDLNTYSTSGSVL